MGVDNNDALLAFLLVCGAGMSTCLGAAVVFNEKLVQLASKKVLGGALAVSAGVMMFVSFAEIMAKAHAGFEDSGFGPSDAYLLSNLFFFLGFVVMMGLDKLVHLLDPASAMLMTASAPPVPVAAAAASETSVEIELVPAAPDDHAHAHAHADAKDLPADAVAAAVDAAAAARRREVYGDLMDAASAGACTGGSVLGGDHGCTTAAADRRCASTEAQSRALAKAASGGGDAHIDANQEEDKALVTMGLKTALAIGLHNFPEGLATFVATLADPKIGMVLAVAIAIHNIPEGVCVSVPIYYATGDRWKAFRWAFYSGLSEPVAALFGWLVLAAVMSDFIYGVLFGLVAGMMVNICVKELLPTAHRYDPEDTVATNCFLAGMAVMSASLVLFVY